jgi:hypothetical protein
MHKGGLNCRFWTCRGIAFVWDLVWIECGYKMGEIAEIPVYPYCKHNFIFPKLLQVNVAYVVHP